ncbi:EAL domain-containing protein [Gallaecimonas sp. GXIMD4217]|uniref:EAL domain-containing protein n=1 Tax=Gallaecimonas sp. GXIMD4217 TaxID=3131927 RepID=UPI00311B0577
MTRAPGVKVRRLLLRCFTFLCCLAVLPLAADPMPVAAYMQPRVLGVNQGLSQNSITAILKDSRGLMWFATQGGLNRYDGERLSVYLSRPDQPYSLPRDFVTALAEDDASLWVGTVQGELARMDRAAEVFQRFEFPGLWGKETVRQLGFDGSRLWIGNDLGLWAWDRVAAPRLVLKGRVRDLKLADGAPLVLLASGELWRLGRDQRQLLLTQPAARRIALSEAGIWLAAEDSLWLLADGQSRLVSRWSVTGREQLLALATLPSGGVLIGLYGRGILHWQGPERLQELGGNHLGDQMKTVRRLHVDDQGLLWVGTGTGGVVLLDPNRRPVRSLVDDRVSLDDGSHNNIRSLVKVDGELWLGTHGRGLRVLASDGRYRDLGPTLAPLLGQDPDDYFIVGLAQLRDSRGRHWLGTDQGLLRLEADGRWRDLGAGLPSQVIWSLLEDGQGRIWAGTASGLALYRDGRFEALAPKRDQGVRVFALAEQSGGLWIGRADGLCRLDLASLAQSCEPKDSLSDSTVRSLWPAEDGSLWVGTQTGLNHRSVDGQWRRWLRQSGLPDDTIYAVLPGRPGQLWLSTNRGLAIFDIQEERFQHQGGTNLTSLEFNGGAYWRDDDGILYFGGTRGLAEVQPALPVRQQQAEPLRLLGYEVDGKARPFMPGQQRLVLGPDALRLTVRFALMDYLEPSLHQYQYRLRGALPGWQELAGRRQLDFTRLPPGHYRLEIRGKAGPDQAEFSSRSLAIKVLPPWYRHPMMLVLYLLSAMVALLWLWWLWHRRVSAEERIQKRIADNEERMRLALVASGHGVWDWDWRNHAVVRSGLEFLGYASDAIEPTPQGLSELIHPDDRQRVAAAVAEHLKGQQDRYEANYRLKTADGRYAWIQDRGQVVERDGAGRVLRLVGIHKDISAERESARRLALSDLVTNAMSEAVLVTDQHLRIVSANPAMEALLGLAEAELQGRRPWTWLRTGSRHHDFSQLHEQLGADQAWAGELWIRDARGRERLTEAEIHWVREAESGTGNLVVLLADITERKAAEQELRFLANYDPLTQLPNRALFRDRLIHAMSRARRNNQQVALLFLDLDRFKTVNDSLGHQQGDLLLQAVAKRLLGAVRDSDTVARLGGDEFTLILEDVPDVKVVTMVAEKVMAALSDEIKLQGHVVSVTPSIGISLFPRDSRDADTLVRYADTAMYHAKAKGRDNFQYYEAAMNAAVQRRLKMESRLRQAIERDRLQLVYQPRMSLGSGQVVAVEALCRWQDPELGQVPPADFIPLAEETGLIGPLGDWVLKTALAQQADWLKAGLSPLAMAVNLSARQFQESDLVDKVRHWVAELGADFGLLELEITETMLLQDPDQARLKMSALRKLGIRLALDDFGTGYSALSYLTRMRFDILKVDRSFVARLPGAADSAAVIRAILALAHDLNMHVVAEGVEEPEQHRFLRGLGCDEGQGYFYAKPMNGNDLLTWIKNR